LPQQLHGPHQRPTPVQSLQHHQPHHHRSTVDPTLAARQYWATPVLHRLEVEFHNGERYLFFRVPLSRYQQFMDSESKGTYFNRYIRNCFAFKHLTRPRRPIVLPLPSKTR
jgi:hypothetical protein